MAEGVLPVRVRFLCSGQYFKFHFLTSSKSPFWGVLIRAVLKGKAKIILKKPFTVYTIITFSYCPGNYWGKENFGRGGLSLLFIEFGILVFQIKTNGPQGRLPYCSFWFFFFQKRKRT